MLIRTIHAPLAQGKPLLVLPFCTLVRWPKGDPMPGVDATYRGPTITATESVFERLRVVLFSSSALDRCEAALDVPGHILSKVYTYTMARHLQYVGKNLCSEVRSHVRAGNAASLHRLVLVAYGKSQHEQISRWNQSTCTLTAVQRGPSGRRRKAITVSEF